LIKLTFQLTFPESLLPLKLKGQHQYGEYDKYDRERDKKALSEIQF
jgi:hypothetical protein